MLTAERIARDILSGDHLHLIVMPTEACNFRCRYCYEEFRLGRMSDAVAGGIERLLDRRAARLRRLDLSWFGGEPLAAADVVLRILGAARRLERAHAALEVRSDMTTNGWHLTPDLFDRLHALGVSRYQVSFDGPPGVHDRARPRRGGGGTFERIWGNLRALRGRDDAFTILVRLHVSRENRAAIPAFLDRLAADFGGDPRFPLFPKLLGRWGGPNDAALDVLTGGDGAAALEDTRRRAAALGIPVHDVDSGATICYAARANSFLIRSDGRVGKCTIALEAPENQVGRLHPDGRLELDPTRLLPWMRGLASGAAAELSCPKRGLVGAAELSLKTGT